LGRQNVVALAVGVWLLFLWLLLQYMRQETKVLRTKQISLDVLAVHDSQCGFLKMLFQPLKVIVLVVFIITMMMV
jgi:hypothetical protein